jgi:hypothetical protein
MNKPWTNRAGGSKNRWRLLPLTAILAGRPWQEGPPRDRGGPPVERKLAAPPAPGRKWRPGAGCAAPPSRPGLPWRRARAHTSRHRDRRRL